jgi:hypothetical protein
MSINSIKAENKRKRTALDCAIRKNDERMADLISQKSTGN